MLDALERGRMGGMDLPRRRLEGGNRSPFVSSLGERIAPPPRAIFRKRTACSRASASGTRAVLPRPRSHRRPLTTVRRTQLFDPLGLTNR